MFERRIGVHWISDLVLLRFYGERLKLDTTPKVFVARP